MMRYLSCILIFSSLIDPSLCLTQSDGYNIGVILGSIIAALIAIAIGAFIFYMCCVRNWLSPEDSKYLAYKRQEDFGIRKPKPRPAISTGKGSYNIRGASVAPKSGYGQREDRYKTDYDPESYDRGGRAARQTFSDDRAGMVSIVGPKPVQPPTTTLRYNETAEFGAGAAAPAVVMSGNTEGVERARNSSNMSYSSESELRGRPTYDGQRAYSQHQESNITYTRAVVMSTTNRGSPPTALSAAYLGTGV